MLLTLRLPRINEHMTTAVITAIHAREGESLAIGAKLLDLSIDLSASASHDCPAISYYRLAVRDRVWLRRLVVAPGDELETDALLAEFSTEAGEMLEVAQARAVRISVAGIVHHVDLWGRS